MTPSSARTRIELWFTLIWGVLLRLALVAGLLYCLYRVRFVIVTVVLGVFLAVGIAPIVEFFDRPRVIPFLRAGTRRFLVTLLVFLALLGVLVACYHLIFTPVGNELTQLIKEWPKHQLVWEQRVTYLREQYETLPPDVRQFIESQDFSRVTTSLTERLRAVITQTLHSTWVVVELILIPVLAYYFVMDSRSLKKEFIFLVPRRRVREALTLLREVGEVLRSYVVGQVILAVVAGVVVGLGLHFVGLSYSLAMGLVAGVTRVVPVIGPILGGIPIVLLATLKSWKMGVWVLVFFSLLHLYESKILMPRVIGYRVRLHPAIIIIVLLIGSEFFGLMGMFLAAPVAAIVKILVNFYIIRPRMRSEEEGGWPLRPAHRPPTHPPTIRDEEPPLEHPAVVAPGRYPRSD
jgi:predicted PurR-regulated permease PerM